MSSVPIPEPVSKRLGYALKRAQHALRTRMDEVLRPLGLTTAQYAVMCVIEQESGISNAGLARAAFVTPQTMTGILSNLHRDGLLSREADPTHGRILRSELTPAGKAKLARAHQVVGELEKIMLKVVGRAKAAHLTELLSQCADNLSAQKDR
jgi:DNA-binding MarR family transcriptional regulator